MPSSFKDQMQSQGFLFPFLGLPCWGEEYLGIWAWSRQHLYTLFLGWHILICSWAAGYGLSLALCNAQFSNENLCSLPTMRWASSLCYPLLLTLLPRCLTTAPPNHEVNWKWTETKLKDNFPSCQMFCLQWKKKKRFCKIGRKRTVWPIQLFRKAWDLIGRSNNVKHQEENGGLLIVWKGQN